jgi:hypothetical protein
MMLKFSDGQYFRIKCPQYDCIQQYHVIKLINLKHHETLKYFANHVSYIYSSSCYLGKMMHVYNKLWNDLEYLPDLFFIHVTSLICVRTACNLFYNKNYIRHAVCLLVHTSSLVLSFVLTSAAIVLTRVPFTDMEIKEQSRDENSTKYFPSSHVLWYPSKHFSCLDLLYHMHMLLPTSGTRVHVVCNLHEI